MHGSSARSALGLPYLLIHASTTHSCAARSGTDWPGQPTACLIRPHLSLPTSANQINSGYGRPRQAHLWHFTLDDEFGAGFLDDFVCGDAWREFEEFEAAFAVVHLEYA